MSGQAHEINAYPALMAEVDQNFEQMLADKGYDGDEVRDDIRSRGGKALIPTRASRKLQQLIKKATYARATLTSVRHRIKNSRRVARCYDKLLGKLPA
jgi:transposase